MWKWHSPKSIAEKADQPPKLAVIGMNIDRSGDFDAANMTSFTAKEADSSADSRTGGRSLPWRRIRHQRG
jgi:hypothetical protein